ncbi:MAG TPA: tautomerase family protein [Bacteroidales bacterium]|nr:tautomerase family protein [Bacteroidales bacterium]HPT03396.1 tautomerase family protein [Bacteroidales bacterium]
MPLVRVEIYKGKDKAYKQAILDGIHNALVSAFRIPESDRNQRIYELDEDDFERNTDKTDCFTIIEITAFEGRSTEAKRKLYRVISDNLKRDPGISETDIIVYLNEPHLVNWGIKGHPASDIDLGFEIQV